jgi:hypothetical protein
MLNGWMRKWRTACDEGGAEEREAVLPRAVAVPRHRSGCRSGLAEGTLSPLVPFFLLYDWITVRLRADVVSHAVAGRSCAGRLCQTLRCVHYHRLHRFADNQCGAAGFEFLKRRTGSLDVRERDAAVQYRLWATLEFSSARRRMSTIVQTPKGSLRALAVLGSIENDSVTTMECGRQVPAAVQGRGQHYL